MMPRLTYSERDKQAKLAALMRKVVMIPFSGCWIWTGVTDPFGYGKTQWGRDQRWAVHRLVWLLHGGDLPPKKLLLHSCDIPCCVNPDHLRLGTHKENSRDMVLRGRCKSRGKKGEEHNMAKLSDFDVFVLRKSSLPTSMLARLFHISGSYVRSLQRGLHRKVAS